MTSLQMRFLCSYWLFRQERLKIPSEIDIMIDSGAFSAMNSGIQIPIRNYAAWLKVNADEREYSNLDIMGDPVGTERNQKLLESFGLTPFPVFHAMEPLQYLRRIVRQYDRFGFGGMVPYINNHQNQSFQNWLRMAWNEVLEEQARSNRIKRVHGFGCTRLKLVLEWPWWSVDSTSWLCGVRFADLRLFVPEYGRFVVLNFFKPDTIYPYRRLLLEEYGLSPSHISIRTRFSGVESRIIALRASARSYQLMEQWLLDKYQKKIKVYLACSPDDFRYTISKEIGDGKDCLL